MKTLKYMLSMVVSIAASRRADVVIAQPYGNISE